MKGSKSLRKKGVHKICYMCLIVLLMWQSSAAQENSFRIVAGTSVATIVYDSEGAILDSICANLLAEDIERVTAVKPKVITDISKASGNIIVVGSIQSALINKLQDKKSQFYQRLQGKWECYGITVLTRPTATVSKALVIAGSDARGTAYGVFTFSEKIGVSPFYWWADVPAKQQTELVITQPTIIAPTPSVKYRGIFINDEDWGLQPWAAKTFEPETGDIGPKTYARVFELLLRLKANLIWPAMHPSTKAFFHYPGNIKTAQDYQIVIGSSHAEPMLRNNVGEWDEKTMGHFNYLTNKDRIYKYWEDRVKESSDINAIYTMGMRGVHDGQMEGIKDLKEAVPIVERIIAEERDLLAKHSKRDVTAIPQVLTVYKEVLDIYDNGLKVPDDITLVWPDDNYGYINRLNNAIERDRKGGSGVYYHASYWGRPHDYLWLSSTHPSLIREEMMKAYENGSNKLWVLNVGDIKPLEYNIQLFMDMAYQVKPFKESSFTKRHLHQWHQKIFGAAKARQLTNLVWNYYNLAFERRPEFMGWSQTEPNTKTTYTDYNHFYYGDEAQKRLDYYDRLETEVKRLRSQINEKSKDAFYQLVYYPVVAASWINKKFLYRDKAHLYGKQKRLIATEYAQLSKASYDSIVKETAYYNTGLAGGKWNHIMSMNPRNLAVYQEPVLPDMNIDNNQVWNISPEGYVATDSSFNAKGVMFLPPFDNLNKQKYFVDIYLSQNERLQWKASVSNDWIRLSKNNGLLNDAPRNKQERIWVNIDWSKIKNNEKLNGTITFEAGDKKRVLQLTAGNIKNLQLTAFKGFIENNGLVAMQATHFSRQFNTSSCQWKMIDGLGYTGKVLQALPISLQSKSAVRNDSINLFNSYVGYDFYTFTAAKPVVNVFALPSHPVNNNYRVCYAISIDNGPLKMVDIKTFGRSEEWKQNVLRNRAERKIEMPYLKAGKHILKLYVVDPGVMIDEIRIDLGGLKKGYSTVAETKVKPG